MEGWTLKGYCNSHVRFGRLFAWVVEILELSGWGVWERDRPNLGKKIINKQTNKWQQQPGNMKGSMSAYGTMWTIDAVP